MNPPDSPAADHKDCAALLAERDRLKAVLARVPEAVVIKIFSSKYWQEGAGFYTVRWGCGVCRGDLSRTYNDRTKHWEIDAGVYAHEIWCPRK